MTTSLPSPELTISDTVSQPDENIFTIPKTFAACQASNDMKAVDMSDDSDGYTMGTPAASVASDRMEKQGVDARSKISSLLKDKEQEWTAVAEKKEKGPLRLLDLPMDVLKEIVKEVRQRVYDWHMNVAHGSRSTILTEIGPSLLRYCTLLIAANPATR